MKETFCSSCGEEIRPEELSVRCSLCLCNYHAACWEKTGGCTTFSCPGCIAADHKGRPGRLGYIKCFNCGEKVVDFASKCRYCHAELKPSSAQRRALPQKNKRLNEPVYRKDPVLTALLNLIFPGAGYMYLGQFSKGLLWFLAAVATWYFTRGFGLIAVYLWVIYDSTRQAIAFNKGSKSGPERMEGF